MLFSGITISQSLPDENQGSIDISGTSNINTFNFHNSIKRHAVNTYNSISDSTHHQQLTHELFIEIEDFENDNTAIKKDFLSLLKFKEYPYINIRVKQKDPDQHTHKTEILPVVLTLCGIKKQYYIDCDIIRQSNNTYAISGQHCIHLKDFGLEPPTKLFGLLKVNDNVYVKFVIKTSTPQHYYNEVQH